jgi:hypothetical protein
MTSAQFKQLIQREETRNGKRKPTIPNLQLRTKPHLLCHFNHTSNIRVITEPLHMQYQDIRQRFDKNLLARLEYYTWA